MKINVSVEFKDAVLLHILAIVLIHHLMLMH